MSKQTPERLPVDLDGWPYRTDTPIGPWRVTPCCAAFAEYNNTGIGPEGLICKRCAALLPDGFVDAPPRLDPAQPAPTQVAYRIEIPPGRDQ
jgi:hypothetical protein